MSIFTATAVGSDGLETRHRNRVADRLARWWSAYMTWRIQQAAVACLHAMTDRELKDIGLTRGEINMAVTRGWPAIPR